MQQSNGKHCYVCGNTHSNECNPDDFDYFQCTECKTLQQLPSDVCGFGGLSGIRCACNREASKVWRHVSFEEYKKLNNAVPADAGNELEMYKLIAADAAENCSSLLKRAEEAERELKNSEVRIDAWKKEIDEMRETQFRRFNNEECWIYQGNGEDYPESLICPVVISAEQLLTFLAAERERDDMKANIDHLMKDCHRFTDKRLNEFAIEQKASEFESTHIPRYAKAGCIGEFGFTIEDGICCPQCWEQQDDDCDLCGGKSNESGFSDLKVTVPWDLCKSIWLAMNKIKAEELRQQLNGDSHG